MLFLVAGLIPTLLVGSCLLSVIDLVRGIAIKNDPNFRFNRIKAAGMCRLSSSTGFRAAKPHYREPNQRLRARGGAVGTTYVLRDYYAEACFLKGKRVNVSSVRNARTAREVAEPTVYMMAEDVHLGYLGRDHYPLMGLAEQMPGHAYKVGSGAHLNSLEREIARAMMAPCPSPWVFAGPTAALLMIWKTKCEEFTNGPRLAAAAEAYLATGSEDPLWETPEQPDGYAARLAEKKRAVMEAAPELFGEFAV